MYDQIYKKLLDVKIDGKTSFASSIVIEVLNLISHSLDEGGLPLQKFIQDDHYLLPVSHQLITNSTTADLDVSTDGLFCEIFNIAGLQNSSTLALDVKNKMYNVHAKQSSNSNFKSEADELRRFINDLTNLLNKP